MQTLKYSFIFLLLTISSSFALEGNWQAAPHLKSRLLITESNDTHISGGIEFTIEDGWKIYNDKPGKNGLPTEIDNLRSQNITNLQFTFPKAKKFDEGHNIITYGYKKHVILPFTAELVDNQANSHVNLLANLAICKDICIPVSQKFSTDVKQSYHSSVSERLIKPFLPKTNYQVILLMLSFAFIGGLILNIMPCVLPVLSIKLLNIIKKGGADKKTIRLSFLATASGIISSFMILAASIAALKHFGKNFGWGIHFQEPIFLIFLILILVIFASNLWGFFHINLPHQLSNIGSKKHKNPYANHFFSGVLATLLSTPCSAPFLGSATAFALGGSITDIFYIFFFMALGLASPYFVLMAFPNLISKFPKPGQWMINVKKFMGFLLLLTALWLIWVVSHQLGFASSLALVIIATLIFKLFAWANKIRFLKKYSLILFLILSVAAFYTPLKIAEMRVEKLKLSQDLWQKFEPQKIQPLVQTGKTVFVNVTADWCITCKINKFFILNKTSVINSLRQENVIAMEADYTNKNEEIYQFLISNNRYGIPFYIIYGPNAPQGIKLPEAITPAMVIKAINEASGR